MCVISDPEERKEAYRGRDREVKLVTTANFAERKGMNAAESEDSSSLTE